MRTQGYTMQVGSRLGPRAAGENQQGEGIGCPADHMVWVLEDLLYPCLEQEAQQPGDGWTGTSISAARNHVGLFFLILLIIIAVAV